MRNKGRRNDWVAKEARRRGMSVKQLIQTMIQREDYYDIASVKRNNFAKGLIKKQEGGPIVDPMGQWAHPYRETIVPTPDGTITMEGVDYPVLGIDETGESKFMKPNKNYKFRGKYVHEIPMLNMQQGGAIAKKQTRENPYINYKNVFSLALGELYPRKFPTTSQNMVSENTAPSMSEMSNQPYMGMQNGGLFGGINSRFRKLIGEDLFDEDDVVKENKAPSVSNISNKEESQVDEAEIRRKQYALDLANEDYEEKKYENNPTFKTNSYINMKSVFPNLGDIDDNVESATQELLQKFPKLKITSGRRNWGDKDAHPVGRAIDLAGEDTDEAWKYYRDVIVPKYKFNPALKPNHGTGKHIHVGYYKEGGIYDLSMKDILELKRQGYDFSIKK